MENQSVQKTTLASRVKQVAVVGTVAVASSPVFAEVDTSGITTELSGAATAGAVVAAAAILIPLGIKVFKYIRSAF